MAFLRAAALLLALILAAQPSALGQSSTTVTLTGGAPAAPLSPTSAATMGVNLGASARQHTKERAGARIGRAGAPRRGLGAVCGVVGT